MGPRKKLARAAFALALSVAAAGCMAPTVPLLSRAQIATDFDTYAIRRVAVLPIATPRDAHVPNHNELRALQEDLTSFVAMGTPYEAISLTPAELSTVDIGAPRLLGRWSIPGLIDLAETYDVDAVLYAEITRERVYAPLAIGAHAELMSVDTGQVIWNAMIELDATDEPTREALERYYGREDGANDGGTRWEVALNSPRRFARFAIWQLVQQL